MKQWGVLMLAAVCMAAAIHGFPAIAFSVTRKITIR